MDVNDTVSRVTDSVLYRQWSRDNPGFYLVHVLYMSKHPPQVGFYNKSTDRMYTFNVDDDISINPEAEVFKNQKSIAQLKLEKVKIDKARALDIVQEQKKEKYPGEILETEIVILQQIKAGLVYNVTYFTKAFKTLNIKVDAMEGKIISHEIASLVGF
jgi:uncharacterized membrane protein YkoI